MTSSEIEPASFRLIAQYLNQLRYLVPQKNNDIVKNIVNLNREALKEFLIVLQPREVKVPGPNYVNDNHP
jgi:hypothetical protein